MYYMASFESPSPLPGATLVSICPRPSPLPPSLPVQVHALALIDPVCCCMWSGHLITNFVYNPERSTTGALLLKGQVMMYVAFGSTYVIAALLGYMRSATAEY